MLIRRKVNGQALSIDEGSNIAYVSTLDDLSQVREGSFLRLSGQSAFYLVSAKRKVKIEEPFSFKNSQCIAIQKILLPQLIEQDVVSLSFLEYELDIVTAILDAGKDYKEGDILFVETAEDAKENKTSFIVKSVKGNGAISKIGVGNRGKYKSIPFSECSLSGGTGSGAKFDLSFNPIQNNLETKRAISKLVTYEGNTFVYLNDAVSTEVKDGKMTVEKWVLEFSLPFSGPSIRGASYGITRDFTPILNLPLVAPNSGALDIAYNQAMNLLEAEIAILRNRIAKLEK